MKTMYTCPRCGCTDQTYFHKGSRGIYCRRCAGFGIRLLEEESTPVRLRVPAEQDGEYAFLFPLTKAQQKVSEQLRQNICDHDVLLQCVCGAGKTEMVVETIGDFLKKGKKVCFAIARRQVVLEVAERMQKYFPKTDVTAVCGGHTDKTDGGLIVCTTHQLYRYYQAFDFLVLDEPDAFPFRGDPVLHGIARSCCRGHTAYLTATPDEELRRRVKEGTLLCLRLDSRPHGAPLPVPEVRICPPLAGIVILVKWLKAHAEHPRMVFMPSISGARRLCRFLRLFGKCSLCTSRSRNRDELIAHYKKKGNGILVCTTVMERGVTVKDCDVCVFHADSGVFDEAGLVQMAGRAGRNFANPYGDVLFLCHRKSEAVERCVEEITRSNRNALSDLS
jgi:competence protein ComFA